MYLSAPPRDDPETCSLRLLTTKTVFLLALATAARVNELHAFSAKPSCLRFNGAEGGQSLSLVTVPGFLAKNARLSVGARTLTVASFPQEPRLCPVRWVRAYLHRTSEVRSPDSQLFLNLRDHSSRTSPQAVSAWIRGLLLQAHRDKGFPPVFPDDAATPDASPQPARSSVSACSPGRAPSACIAQEGVCPRAAPGDVRMLRCSNRDRSTASASRESSSEVQRSRSNEEGPSCRKTSLSGQRAASGSSKSASVPVSSRTRRTQTAQLQDYGDDVPASVSTEASCRRPRSAACGEDAGEVVHDRRPFRPERESTRTSVFPSSPCHQDSRFISPKVLPAGNPAHRGVAGTRLAHEVRSASVMSAASRGAPLSDIVRAVGWRSESTFATHYIRAMEPATPGTSSVQAPSCHLPH